MTNIEKLAKFADEQGKEYISLFLALIELGLKDDLNNNTEKDG